MLDFVIVSVIKVVVVFAVLALVAIAWLLAAAGLQPVFGMWIPYVAILVFLVGFVLKIVKWARAPSQYRIPTTAGQQTSLTWIKGAKLESPPNGFWTFLRMALEVLFFRSLFRKFFTRTVKDRYIFNIFHGYFPFLSQILQSR